MYLVRLLVLSSVAAKYTVSPYVWHLYQSSAWFGKNKTKHTENIPLTKLIGPVSCRWAAAAVTPVAGFCSRQVQPCSSASKAEAVINSICSKLGRERERDGREGAAAERQWPRLRLSMAGSLPQTRRGARSFLFKRLGALMVFASLKHEVGPLTQAAAGKAAFSSREAIER